MHANTSGHRRYGIMGQMGKSYGSASLTIGSRNWKNTPEGVKEYTKVRLYVGQTGDFTPSLAAGGQTKPITNKSGDNRLAVYSWEMDTPVKRVALRMQGQAEVYGVSLEGSSGIALDNIPFRGSSGTFFSSLDSTLMRTMAESLRVGLVIVQFGGNTLPYAKTTKAIQHYKTQMSRQIDFLRRTMPMAKIVLIGPSDMSTKVDGRLQTYPQMEEFVEALRQAANENGAAFWSIYDAMGGKNSMINWVKNSPPMAAPDYIHFNERGVNRIASLFFESLMLYYDYYASGELRIES